MLLAVAGLDEAAVTQRARQLASVDWPGVPPAERAAFLFARKLSQTPWEVTTDDFRLLESYFGRHRAVDVVWWAARCQYMTRVADAFQLPLERENAFRPLAQPSNEKKANGQK